MEDRKFTTEKLEEMKALSANEYLRKSPDEKYADFAESDPFPDIPTAVRFRQVKKEKTCISLFWVV